MVSVSSSSSSSSDDEPPLEMVLASGSSSSSGEERPADVKHRGMVAMWTWPTPRSYGSTLEVTHQVECASSDGLVERSSV